MLQSVGIARGIAWIVVMTWICLRRHRVSANLQKALLGVELAMLAVLSIWALTRVGLGTAPTVTQHRARVV